MGLLFHVRPFYRVDLVAQCLYISIEGLFIQIDTDNDGVVDFDEFLGMMTKHREEERGSLRSEMRDIFEVTICLVSSVLGIP